MAVRNMIITYIPQTQFLLPSSISSIPLRNPITSYFLHRRLLSSSTVTKSNFEKEPSSSSCSDTILKHGDWTPPKIVRAKAIYDLLDVDLGRWIIRLHDHSLFHYSEKGLYDLSVQTLAPFVGGRKKEAKQRIYLISACLDSLGFGAYVDKEIADKLNCVECVEAVSPDFFDDIRRNDPRTRRMSQLSEQIAESAEVQNSV